ncbi:MAG: hypothetical protein AAF717_17795 [Bacteroidota bacterium]
MKEFNKSYVVELSEASTKNINGGSWLGEAVGTILGAMVRYSGPIGANNICADVALYMSR